MHTDAAVMAHLGGRRTEQQTLDYLATNLLHWSDHGFGLWILRELNGAEPIGRGLLRYLRVDAVDELEVGYAFYEPFWGRGYATEIMSACLVYGRERLHHETFVALTSPDNRASQRVLVKSGFQYVRPFEHDGAAQALFRTYSGPAA